MICIQLKACHFSPRLTAQMIRVLLKNTTLIKNEHGEVTGLAGASSAPGSDGKQLAQWTLTISGAGTLYVAAEETDGRPSDHPGYLGARRGLIVGGTGAFANATGVLRERWPNTGNGALAFDVSLVTN